MLTSNSKNNSRIWLSGTLLTMFISSGALAQDETATAREQQAARLRVEVDARIAELDEEYATRAAELREQFEASKRELYENTEDVFQRSSEETAINRVYQDSLMSLQREINSRRNAVYAAQREANGQLSMEGAISPSTWAAISSAPLVDVGIDPGALGSGSSVGSIGTEAAARELPEETTTYQPSITRVSEDEGPSISVDLIVSGSGLVPADRESVGVRVTGRGRYSDTSITANVISWSDDELIVEVPTVSSAAFDQMSEGRIYEIVWLPDGHAFAGWIEYADEQFAANCASSPDRDGDGHASVACGGADCDDTDANRYPGNIEVGDPEGHDEDCDPQTLGGPSSDWDNDGFVSNQACNLQSDGRLLCGTDCNDRDGAINPDQRDFCDGIDNNCDGILDDEDGNSPWYPDEDRDLFGDMHAASQMRCYFGRPEGWVDNNYDCDDSDPTINPITGHCRPGQ